MCVCFDRRVNNQSLIALTTVTVFQPRKQDFYKCIRECANTDNILSCTLVKQCGLRNQIALPETGVLNGGSFLQATAR